MKKIVRLFLLLIAFSVLFASFVYASDELLAKRDIYVEAQKKFASSRQSYLNNPTLQLKDVLTDDLRDFLYARNDLLIVYFQNLLGRSKDYLVSADFEAVSSWQNYLKQQNQQIVSEVSLLKMISLADDFSDSSRQINTDVHKSLAFLTIAEQEAIIKKIELFQLKIAQGLISGPTDKDLIIMWLGEVAKKLEMAKLTHDQVREIVAEMRLIRGAASDDTDLKKANDQLVFAEAKIKEAIIYLDEIVKRIEENG